MNPLYNIGIDFYALAVKLAARRSAKAHDLMQGQARTLATLRRVRAEVAPDGYDVWIHVASLGEFEQARPLIERLRRERPEFKILLTFFSPSGYNVRCNYDRVDSVAYLPLDRPAAVTKFLDAAAPRMAIFVKYEFWGNYLQQLKRRGIPTYIISAIFRPGQRFFRLGGGWARKALRCFSHLYVQDQASSILLSGIGIDNVTVAGDTRFDRVTDIMRGVRPVPVVEAFVKNSPFTLLVGSSWPADEEVYIPWLRQNTDVRAVIAPHEFDSHRLEALRRQLPGKVRLLSEIKSPEDLTGDESVLIIDCFGLLSSLYSYADAAYVGGGFGAGIHNINEAAVYGIPVVFGPNHHKFKEATDLIAAGGAFEVTSKRDAAAVLDRLRDPSQRRAAGEAAALYIKANLGATDLIYNDLFSKS